MSRSLTAAARSRYAPCSLGVLWRALGSRTATERFVDAVAGRWEQSALELEELFHARAPAATWSERSLVENRRKQRVGRMPACGRLEPGCEEEPAAPHRDVAAASSVPSRLDPIAPTRRVKAARAAASRSRAASRGGEGRRMESVRGESGSAGEESLPTRESVPRDEEVEVGPSVPERVRSAPVAAESRASSMGGSAEPPYQRASRRPAGRLGEEIAGSLHDAGTASDLAGATGRAEGPGGSIRPPASPRFRSPVWDQIDDSDEEERRRFDRWSLERRWRDEALREWQEQEF